MLDKMAADGVEAAVATPHFLPGDTLDGFLRRRAEALSRLDEARDPSRHPKIFLAAEVAYFRGISRSSSLSRLCVEGTPYILLEMPHSRWGDDVVREIESFSECSGLEPILAHIERYLPHQWHGVLSRLAERGVTTQASASFFTDKATVKHALKMLKSGEIKLLGSDCHNTTTRPPNLGEAASVITAAGLSAELYRAISRAEDILGL